MLRNSSSINESVVLKINVDENYVISNFVISGLTLTASQFVFWFYQIKKKILLKSPSSKLTISLLISQTLLGLAFMLTQVTYSVPALRLLQTRYAYTYRICVDIYKTFCVTVMLIHLCGSTFDRYLSLFYSYKYKAIVTCGNVSRFLVFAWIFPFITSIAQVVWLREIIDGIFTQEERDKTNGFDVYYSLFSFVIYLLIPVFFISICLTAMFIKIRKIITRTRTIGRYSPTKELRVLILFTVMYLCFLALIMPYFTLRLIMDLKTLNGDDELSMNIIYNITGVLRNLSLLIFPLLFACNNPDFEKAFKRSWSRIPLLFNSENVNNRNQKPGVPLMNWQDNVVEGLKMNIDGYDSTSIKCNKENGSINHYSKNIVVVSAVVGSTKTKTTRI